MAVLVWLAEVSIWDVNRFDMEIGKKHGRYVTLLGRRIFCFAEF